MAEDDGIILLDKGEAINLSKSVPGLKLVRVALGWKPNDTGTGQEYDLDVSAFVLRYEDTPMGHRPRLITNKHMVFYGNGLDPEGAVMHGGDNRDGSLEYDDEKMWVNREKLHGDCREVAFFVTIHKAEERKQSFKFVQDAYIRLIDEGRFREVFNRNKFEEGSAQYAEYEKNCLASCEITRFNLTDEFKDETAVQFGSLYFTEEGEMQFKAIGAGWRKDLAAIVGEYGLRAKYSS